MTELLLRKPHDKEFPAPVLGQQHIFLSRAGEPVQSLRPSSVPEQRQHSNLKAALIKSFSVSLKTLTSTEGDQNGSPPADRQGVALRFSEVCSESQSGTFPPVVFLLITVTSPQKKILLTRRVVLIPVISLCITVLFGTPTFKSL